MSSDLLFQYANMLAMSGWLVLLASPFMPRIAQAWSAVVVPGLLSVTYTGLVMAFWTRSSGGFDTLDNVAALFETRELLLAGWLHYLAFDLFVGAWEVRTARREAIAFWFVVPCLVLTFLFGPAGFLAFCVLRLVVRQMPRAIAA